MAWFKRGRGSIRIEKQHRAALTRSFLVFLILHTPLDLVGLSVAEQPCITGFSLIETDIQVRRRNHFMIGKEYDDIFEMELPSGQAVRVGIQDAGFVVF